MTLKEERLRTRIRQTFHLNDPKLPQKIANEVENEVLAFIRNYAQAPEWQKDAVYARQEERLLQLLSDVRGDDTINKSSLSRNG